MKTTFLNKKHLILASLLMFPGLLGAGTANAEEHCREVSKTVHIGGQLEKVYGTACLQPDGAWKIVSRQTPIVLNEYVDETPSSRSRDVIVLSDGYRKPRNYRSVYYAPSSYYYKNKYWKQKGAKYNRKAYNHAYYKNSGYKRFGY